MPLEVHVREERADAVGEERALDEEWLAICQPHSLQTPDRVTGGHIQCLRHVGIGRLALEGDDLTTRLFAERARPGGEADKLVERLGERSAAHRETPALGAADSAVGTQRGARLPDGAARDLKLAHEIVFGGQCVAGA